MIKWHQVTRHDKRALLAFRSATPVGAPEFSATGRLIAFRPAPWADEVDLIIHDYAKLLPNLPAGITIHAAWADARKPAISALMVVQDRFAAGIDFSSDFTLVIGAVRHDIQHRGHGKALLDEFEKLCTQRAREYGLSIASVTADVRVENVAMNALLTKRGWSLLSVDDGFSVWHTTYPVTTT